MNAIQSSYPSDPFVWQSARIRTRFWMQFPVFHGTNLISKLFTMCQPLTFYLDICDLYEVLCVFIFIYYWHTTFISSSIDLSNIAAAVYSTELCNRLRGFLAAWPPSSPQLHVNELLIATADFERNLESWNIRLVKSIEPKLLMGIYSLNPNPWWFQF